MGFSRETIRLDSNQTFRLLRWEESVTKVEEILSNGVTIERIGQGDHWHYHKEQEFTLIKRGSGTRFIADRIELFDSGDLALIGSNVPHYWQLNGSSSGLSVQWDFPLDHGVWNFGEAAPLKPLSKKALRGIIIRGQTAISSSQQLETLSQTNGLERLAAFLQLLSGLAEAPEEDLHYLSDNPFSLIGSVEQQEAIRRSMSYILARYRERIRLPELLELSGMSRATFARQFQRHAGKSFTTFLNQVRLQAVCRNLRETSDAVSSIAFDHGFNQLSFFNRLFQREFQMSPTAYRNSQSPPC